jgi:hypothetical protein
VCGPAPAETCNGVDDDCDGRVDETLGPHPACPLQDGVCRGATATCRGAAGWVCDAAVYAAHDMRYEATERACDAVDDDCDGTVDHVRCQGDGIDCTEDTCIDGVCHHVTLDFGATCPGGYCRQRECLDPTRVCTCANDTLDCTLDLYDAQGHVDRSRHVDRCLCDAGDMEVDGSPVVCTQGCANRDDGRHICF